MIITIIFALIALVSTHVFLEGGTIFLFFCPPMLVGILLIWSVPSIPFILIDRFYLEKRLQVIIPSKVLYGSNTVASIISLPITAITITYLSKMCPNPSELEVFLLINSVFIVFLIIFGLVKYDLYKTKLLKVDHNVLKKYILRIITVIILGLQLLFLGIRLIFYIYQLTSSLIGKG